MSLAKFIEDFEAAVEDIEPGSLTATTKYRELEAWDSLAFLTVIAMIDAEYDLRLKGDVLKSCETLAALYAQVSA